MNIRAGEYASAGAARPLMLIGSVTPSHVRADVDEKDAWRVRPDARAVASIRGNSQKQFPLRFVSIEPYVVPKRNLTSDAAKRVDARVLQIIYALPDGKPAGYVFECLDFAATERKFNSYLAKFYPAKPGQVRQHQHMGVEFIYIIRGKLGLLMGEEEHVLATDDAVYFDASAPHGYRRIGSRECRGFVVTQG